MTTHFPNTVFVLAAASLCAAIGTVARAETSASQASPPAVADANQQVLQDWQRQTGQAVAVNPSGKVEFHGQATVDAYDVATAVPSNNAALSPLRAGSFGLSTLQGDWRHLATDDVATYVQGTFTSTNDRVVQSRYAAVVSNLQAGRAASSYQMSVGDVAAGFSGLGANVGLRGLLGTKLMGNFGVTAFAGTVAESWEALVQRVPLNGTPARTAYLRDVMGVKADYKLTPGFTAFSTVQTFQDRTGSAALPAGSPALDGTTATVGGQFQQGEFRLNSELAQSRKHDNLLGRDVNGNAFVADGTYNLPDWRLRFGHHNVGEGFAALGASVSAGVHAWFVGADWTISPALMWGVDARNEFTRALGTRAFNDSLSNRLQYNVLTVPGLAFSATDTRSKTRDPLGNAGSLSSTQASMNYGSATWTGNASTTLGHARSALNAAANSNSEQVALGLGRNFSDATSSTAATWTFSLQGTAGVQIQKLLSTAMQSRTNTWGVNMTGTSERWGSLNLGWLAQNTLQPLVGAARLSTTGFNFDWTKILNGSWTVKAYAKQNRRNHGDTLLAADDRVFGIQGALKW